MTSLSLERFPASMQAKTATRWSNWFDEFFARQRSQRRRKQSRRQLEAIDPRILQDAGIGPAQRFFAINKPSWEW